MNCEECIERVFELIEQEPRDPAGVHEVLERCPECRALFADMKTALEQAAALPLEEPSAATDEAILRAARARIARGASAKHRWLAAPQWAAAAVALLAIGVGVWTIPRGEEPQFESEIEVEDAVADSVKEELPAAPTRPKGTRYEDSMAQGGSAAMAALGDEPAAAAPPARRRREAKTRPHEVRAEEAESDSAEVGALAGAALANDSAMRAEAAPAAASKKQSARGSRLCEERVAKIEGEDRAPTPEESLALGRCYREAGDVPEARRWFEAALLDRDTRAAARRELRALPSQ